MDDQREPQEDLDRWLHARIDPLPPPPGTFDQIRRRVRRRRYRQVAVSAAVAAAVAAAIVVVPRATSVLTINPSPAGQKAAAGGSATATAPGRAAPMRPSGESPESSGATPLPRLPSVPGNFDPTSATFIGPHSGWAIGQAGTPGHCSTQYCTSVARTTDAGQTWTGVPAPLTGAPDGASGVGQIRFLNASNGWAFGPELFATTDGGQHWAREGTNGLRVTDLETVGTRAFAVLAACTGSGADFAAQCTSFSLYSTPAGRDDWSPVAGATSLSAGGPAGSASLVLTSGRGYLLAPDGSLYAGPVDGTGSWQQVSSSPAGAATCTPGAAQASGQPSGAFLAAASPTSLVLACSAAGASGGGAQVFTSSDGGQSWQPAGTVSGATVTSAAAQPGGEIVLSTTDGIQVSRDNGASWQAADLGTAGPSGGFSWVGMTSPSQGVATAADPSGHRLWFTFDGGRSWQPSVLSGS